MTYTPHEILAIAKAFKAILYCFLGIFVPPAWIIVIPLLIYFNHKLYVLLKNDSPLLWSILYPLTGACIAQAKEAIEEHGFKVGITGPNISEIESSLN